MCEPLSRERDADHETEYETRSSLSAAPGTKGHEGKGHEGRQPAGPEESRLSPEERQQEERSREAPAQAQIPRARRVPARQPLARVRVQGRDLLLHLVWQAGTDEDGDLDALLDETGTGAGAGRAAQAARARASGIPCNRLVSSRGRFGMLHLSALPSRPLRPLSLAALLARVQPTGLAVLALRDADTRCLHYWVWAARRGCLSARADRSFASQDEALAFASSLQESLGLDEALVCSEQESLALVADMLDSADREVLRSCQPVPLEPLSLSRILAMGTGLVLALGLLLGGSTLWEWWQNREAFHLRSQSRSELVRQKREVLAHPEQHFVAAWAKAPAAADLVRGVLPAMLDFPMAGNGWALVELTGRHTSSGAQSGALLDARWHALPQASLLHPPAGAVLERKNPEYAQQSLPLSVPLPLNATPLSRLPDRDELQQQLSELSRRFGLRLRLAFKKVETLTIGEETIAAPWINGTLTLDHLADYMVSDWPALASALELPGVSLTAIAWDGRSWTCTGQVSVRR